MKGSWREQKKNELREAIYDTSLRLFRKLGYENTSVQQITEALGVGKGTFFNHFPAKEDVVAEWYSRLTESSLAEVEDRAFDSAEEALCELAATIARRGEADPDLVAAKTRVVTSSRLVSDAERRQDEQAMSFFRLHLEAGIARNELDLELDVELFSGTAIAVLTGTARAWVQSGHAFGLEELARKRIAFLFRAARP